MTSAEAGEEAGDALPENGELGEEAEDQVAFAGKVEEEARLDRHAVTRAGR